MIETDSPGLQSPTEVVSSIVKLLGTMMAILESGYKQKLAIGMG